MSAAPAKINVGQVPPIQDRQHREFLKRLGQSIENLKSQVANLNSPSASGGSPAGRSDFLASLDDVYRRLTALESASSGFSTVLYGLSMTILRAEHGISNPMAASVRDSEGNAVSVAVCFAENGDVILSSTVPLDGHTLYIQ